MKALKMVLVVAMVVMAVLSSVAGTRAAEPIKIGAAYGLQGVWSDWCKRNLIAIEMADRGDQCRGWGQRHASEIGRLRYGQQTR